MPNASHLETQSPMSDWLLGPVGASIPSFHPPELGLARLSAFLLCWA